MVPFIFILVFFSIVLLSYSIFVDDTEYKKIDLVAITILMMSACLLFINVVIISNDYAELNKKYQSVISNTKNEN